MYKYVNDKAHWIFESDETLEEIHSHRFSKEIVLIDITNNSDVQEGWDYDSSTGIFSESTELALTSEEQIAALDSTYETRINKLAQDYAIALMADSYFGTTAAVSILGEYKILVAEYAAALEAIK